MKTRKRSSRAILALPLLVLLSITCGVPTPATTVPYSAVPATETPAAPGSKLRTTVTISGPDDSLQVTGALKDQAGAPIAGATVEFSATALEGSGLVAQYTLTGTVPADAKQADVGFRVNTECNCSGTSDFVLYSVSYTQEGESNNRVPNSNIAQGWNGWGFWGDGTAFIALSDQGQGQMLHVSVTRSQSLGLNSTIFPVTAGSTYTVTFTARVNPVSAGSGYFDIIFLKNETEGTRETIPLKAATVTIGSASTDSGGAFSFPLSQLPAGKFRLEAEYAGDDRTSPAKVSATVFGPTAIPTIAPTPMPAEQVWFGPNMGSTDFPELFSKPEQWPEVRSRIDVLKFFPQNLLEVHWPLIGDNTLSAFVEVDAFRKLTEWGIAIDIDVGAVKPWGCTGVEEFKQANTAIQNVQANGGTVAILDMDSPHHGGEWAPTGTKPCGYTMEQTADATALFVRLVKAAYPNIIIGETEPYPYFSVAETEQWILALEERGAKPAFFHLDVNLTEQGKPANIDTDLPKL
ncbi:MAG: Ig-like domain-containing protein, partial [Chloroflexota bacterium]